MGVLWNIRYGSSSRGRHRTVLMKCYIGIDLSLGELQPNECVSLSTPLQCPNLHCCVNLPVTHTRSESLCEICSVICLLKDVEPAAAGAQWVSLTAPPRPWRSTWHEEKQMLPVPWCTHSENARWTPAPGKASSHALGGGKQEETPVPLLMSPHQGSLLKEEKAARPKHTHALKMIQF